ncbi:EAL domain-containing protein [Oxalobacteraceae bacterium A2-2]
MAVILIVDDHVLNRHFLSALLGFGHHQLHQAADGDEGLEQVRRHRPDLIVTDIMMPRMNGYDFIRAVRDGAAGEWARQLPVIFYTSTYSTHEAKAMARECGVRWVLQKPSPPLAILRAVHQALALPLPSATPAVPAAPGKLGAPLLGGLEERLNSCLQDAERSSHQLSDPTRPGPDAGAGEQLASSLEELQSVSLRLTALIDMGMEMTRARDPAALLAQACKLARHLGVARYAVIGIVDDGGWRLRHVTTLGMEADQEQELACTIPESGILRRLLRERATERLHGSDCAPAKLGLPPGHPAVHSFLGVPVGSSERNYGWIYLANKLGTREFSEVDERTVATVATQLALAYENLLLYERIQDHVHQLQGDLIERQRIAGQLRESESRFRQIAEHIDEVFFLTDVVYDKLLYISPAYEQVWGQTCASVVDDPRAWMASIHPDDAPRIRALVAQRGLEGFEYQYRIVRPDGQVRHVRSRGFPIRDENGVVYRMAGLAADVTVQARMQERITSLSQLYAVLSGINSAIVRIHDRDELLQEACRVAVSQGAFHLAWAGVVDADTMEGRVVACQGAPQAYVDRISFSADPASPQAGRPASQAVREQRQVISDDIATDPAMAPLRDELLSHGLRSLAVLPLGVDQRSCAVIALFSTERGFFAQEGRLTLLDELAGDLSFGLQYIAREERLHYLAYYDVLTGLPNSMLFQDRLQQLIHTTPREACAAVISINLDRFAQVNDVYGRHVGDAVLKQLGAALQSGLPAPCSAARIGGDSFAVALGSLAAGERTAAWLETRLTRLLEQPLMVGRQEIRLAVRLGIAIYPGDGGNAEQLFKNAEVALNRARRSGERCVFYAPQMNESLSASLALETALRQALESGQFSMYYQPKVSLECGRVVGAEALIRWRHPERGLVPPAEFIPLAEQTGLIVPMGEWIIDSVCAQQAAWRAAGLETVPVAINLSALQFRKGSRLQQTISAALHKHGVAAAEITFELTESAVMEDPEQAAAHLRGLKQLGVKLSLDDFGTGHSSLAYLKRFPFDQVKVDRSFITDVTSSVEDAALVAAIIAMGHSLGLGVVAEGVETASQLAFLRRLRCDELQGYYFSPPLPAAGLGELLASGRRMEAPVEAAPEQAGLLVLDQDPARLAALRRQLADQGYQVAMAPLQPGV